MQNMPKLVENGFMKSTQVHTKVGLRPIGEIQVGDWVRSQPEHPEKGAENVYKRVTKTFHFANKQVLNFCWFRHDGESGGEFGHLFSTPGLLVWSHPQGWMPVAQIPGTTLGPTEWLGRNLVMEDATAGERYDVQALYQTDKPEVAFKQEDAYGFGKLLDLSVSPHKFLEELKYDYEKWGDPVNETREIFSSAVYNLEVEDWHTFFVGKTGLWVHDATASVV